MRQRAERRIRSRPSDDIDPPYKQQPGAWNSCLIAIANIGGRVAKLVGRGRRTARLDDEHAAGGQDAERGRGHRSSLLRPSTSRTWSSGGPANGAAARGTREPGSRPFRDAAAVGRHGARHHSWSQSSFGGACSTVLRPRELAEGLCGRSWRRSSLAAEHGVGRHRHRSSEGGCALRCSRPPSGADLRGLRGRADRPSSVPTSTGTAPSASTARTGLPVRRARPQRRRRGRSAVARVLVGDGRERRPRRRGHLPRHRPPTS